jgi:malate dehydrogenase (oxaloacetate-decarboxylating)
VRAREINDEMKVAAAFAIANLIQEDELRSDYIIPGPSIGGWAPPCAKAVPRRRKKSGAARI